MSVRISLMSCISSAACGPQVGLCAVLSTAALGTPTNALADSWPDPCYLVVETAQVIPREGAIRPDTRLALVADIQDPACEIPWQIEVQTPAGVQRFDGSTTFSRNAIFFEPDLEEGDTIEVRVLSPPAGVQTYTVDSETADSEAWVLDPPREPWLTGQHRRRGVKTVGAGVSAPTAPQGSRYAELYLDDGTYMGAVAPTWNLSARAEVDKLLFRDGDPGCVTIEERLMDGALYEEHEFCGTYRVTDLRRLACSSIGPVPAGGALLAMLTVLGLRRRRPNK